jgi:predicted TPR repeat methyltransferase
MISETGVWSEEEQHAHIFSYNVARFVHRLIRENDVSSALYDFGCGNGKYTRYFMDLGYWCAGYDGYINIDSPFFIKQDLTKPFKIDIKGNILCLEVWEHIPAKYEDAFINNIINNLSEKSFLILSVAVDGQEGLGHVNCRSNEYVIDKLQSKGLKYNEHLTNEIRKEPENYVAYFRETLMVFEK